MNITRGTTPKARLTAKSVNLTEKQLQITFTTGDRKIVKETGGDDVAVSYDGETGNSIILVALNQAETLLLRAGAGRCQVRSISEMGKAGASKITGFVVDPILQDGLLEWRDSGGI